MYFDAILDAISGAEEYILIQFYIFRDDDTGKRFRDSLVAKAREGVAVYLLIDNCAMGFITLIDGAKDRLWLATPYFVPDDKIVTALQLAAMRGVDVRVIVPDLVDSQLVHLSSFSYFKQLKDSGVKIYRYQKGFLHQKVMIVDHSLSVIGSANLDNRSFRLNFEVTGIVSDTAFNADVVRMLEADLANSHLIGSDALAEKPFWFRLSVRLARMRAPIQ